MNGKIVAMAAAVVLAFCLVGCGSSSSSAASASGSASSASASASASSAAKDFDGSAYSDTGEGTMMLRTPGGTTEDGKVPQAVINKNTVSTQFSVEYEKGDGTVCVVYVDGHENMKMNAADHGSTTITLEGEAIEPGVHTVEVVAMNGDEPVIYKKAQYEIVI